MALASRTAGLVALSSRLMKSTTSETAIATSRGAGDVRRCSSLADAMMAREASASVSDDDARAGRRANASTSSESESESETSPRARAVVGRWVLGFR